MKQEKTQNENHGGKKYEEQKDFLIALLTLLFSFALTGCFTDDGNCDSGIHTFGAWESVTAATCLSKGEDNRVCTICAAKETRDTNLSGHHFVSIDGKKSTECKDCKLILIDNSEISTFAYAEDKDYRVEFTDATDIAALVELGTKTVKSLDVQLFKDKNYAPTQTIVFTSPTKLYGNGATLNITTARTNAFTIECKKFTAQNFTLNSTVAIRVFTVKNTATDMLIDGVTANLAPNLVSRGISYPTYATDSILNVRNSAFLIGDNEHNSVNAVYNSDCRGISLFNPKGATVNIENSQFKGFSYVIHIGGQQVNAAGEDVTSGGFVDATGLTVSVNKCELYGWGIFNVWVRGATINLKNSNLKGINNSTGATNSFSLIIINADIYEQFDGVYASAITLNIDGCKLENYQNETALAGPSKEQFIRIDIAEGVSKIDIKNTQFIDTTGKIDSVFYTTSNMTSAEFKAYLDEKVTMSSDVTAVTRLPNPQNPSENLPDVELPFVAKDVAEEVPTV